MSKALAIAWENTYGLLVDDGQLAIGILASLAVAWTLATYGPGIVRDLAGWVLFGLLAVVMVGNLYRAGVNARRRVAGKRT